MLTKLEEGRQKIAEYLESPQTLEDGERIFGDFASTLTEEEESILIGELQ